MLPNVAMADTDEVAPSEVEVGNQIQDPRTKRWFLVSCIRISFAAKQQRIFGPYGDLGCDAYYFSGAGGKQMTCFEGQQLVHRAELPAAPASSDTALGNDV